MEIERTMHGLEFLLSVLGTMVTYWSVNQLLQFNTSVELTFFVS